MSTYADYERAQKVIHDSMSKTEWEKLKGYLAVFEINSEDFFIGDEFHPPMNEPHEKYPNGKFITIRIGHDVTYTTGAAYQQPITFIAEESVGKSNSSAIGVLAGKLDFTDEEIVESKKIW